VEEADVPERMVQQMEEKRTLLLESLAEIDDELADKYLEVCTFNLDSFALLLCVFFLCLFFLVCTLCLTLLGPGNHTGGDQDVDS
jgi:hypothetical protein